MQLLSVLDAVGCAGAGNVQAGFLLAACAQGKREGNNKNVVVSQCPRRFRSVIDL
jgi:hypothetical protein